MSVRKFKLNIASLIESLFHQRFKCACAVRYLPILLLLTTPVAVQAQFNFVTNNGTITITKYTGSGGAVAIPSATNGLPVIGIGPLAFYYSPLTGVTIPSSITSIGTEAFFYCTNLTSVVIPNSDTNLGNEAFYNCSSLTNATVGNNVPNIGTGVFNSCIKLTSITIPNSVTNIGQQAFMFCSSLTNVIIGDNVVSIGSYAFLASGLTSVRIPNGVTNIGSYAFDDCPFLASVTIPASVSSIGAGAFAFCPSLAAITVDALNLAYSSLDGVLFDRNETFLIQYPIGNTNSIYTIPNSVHNIGGSAFGGCTNLTGVTLPNSVTNIGGYAFENCYALASITIPGSVGSIGSYAFENCTNLAAAYFEGNAPNADSTVFSGDNTTVYYLPNTSVWSPTFGGVPTALWLPQVETGNASFGVQTNHFGFSISWASGEIVVVDACTNLSNPVWLPVETDTLTGGSVYFSDPQWANYPSRFYRLRSP